MNIKKSRWRAKLPANPFTLTGRMLGLATASTLFTVIDSSLAPLLSLLIWLLAASFLFGLIYRPRLQVSYSGNDLYISGQAGTIEVRLKNIGRLAAYDLYLHFPKSALGFQVETNQKYIGELEAGEQTAVVFQVAATRRGEHQLPFLQVVSLFPFGMFRFVSVHILYKSILVSPNYKPISIEEILSNSSEVRSGDPRSLSRRDFEYIGSREYRDGMQVRRWDFAAWARHGVPAIREFNEDNCANAIVVVDATNSSAREIDEQLELLLSRAASACAGLIASDFQIRLVIVLETIEIVDSFNERDPLDYVLRTLAKVKGTKKLAHWLSMWSQLEQYLSDDTLLIVHLRNTNAAASEAFLQAIKSCNSIVDWIPEAFQTPNVSAPHFLRKSATRSYTES